MLQPDLTLDAILAIRELLKSRFLKLTTTTGSDPKLDGSFGLTFYALSVLEETCAPGISQMIVARLALRAVAESLITLAYLVKQDDKKLWRMYRNYGHGTAKLAFLKLEEETGDLPNFVTKETLHEIANEDQWQEYVDIELGHWANKNLRELAVGGGTKDIYDRFYDWTSAFTHGMWGAVRDSNFVTCGNALHRLHRIPRPFNRVMSSTLPDAVMLLNKCLEQLELAYPAMEALGRLKIGKAPQDKNAEFVNDKET